jgi:hypothetical protein
MTEETNPFLPGLKPEAKPEDKPEVPESKPVLRLNLEKIVAADDDDGPRENCAQCEIYGMAIGCPRHRAK